MVQPDALTLAARQAPPKRDLNNVVPLSTLSSLTPRQLDILSLKLAGQSHDSIASKLSIAKKDILKLLKEPAMQAAIAEATLNLKMGLLTAADVAQATEAEVLTKFYKLAMNEQVPLEWRHKFGMSVLNHRINIMKAAGSMLPRNALPSSTQVEIIELESHVKDRMAESLRTLEASPVEPPESSSEATEETPAKEEVLGD